jgi:CII-binding regulator of phage lambda lysogenization HflD
MRELNEMGLALNREETPTELVQAKIKNLREQLSILSENKATDTNTEMTEIYDKRISELMTQIAELESRIE